MSVGLCKTSMPVIYMGLKNHEINLYRQISKRLIIRVTYNFSLCIFMIIFLFIYNGWMSFQDIFVFDIQPLVIIIPV